MTEMIDRVAEAIAISGNGGTWDDWYNEDQKEFHRKRARAAVTAMREPTTTMEDHGWGAVSADTYPVVVWRLMIEGALKEP